MQQRINDQAAFIIHRRDYQDSSLILELFTQDYGRLSVLAKAAKKRRDTGHFQMCNRLLVGWSGRSELKILTQIESRPLSVPANFYPGVFYVNELLLYLLPKHDEQLSLFQRYQMLLLNLAQPDTPQGSLEPLLREFEINLLTELGVMPDVSFDHSTGQTVMADQRYCFDVLCGAQLTGVSTANTFSGAELLGIRNLQFDSTAVLAAARRLMRQIIDYNLQGRTLQSRKFYQQMKKILK